MVVIKQLFVLFLVTWSLYGLAYCNEDDDSTLNINQHAERKNKGLEALFRGSQPEDNFRHRRVRPKDRLAFLTDPTKSRSNANFRDVFALNRGDNNGGLLFDAKNLLNEDFMFYNDFTDEDVGNILLVGSENKNQKIPISTRRRQRILDGETKSHENQKDEESLEFQSRELPLTRRSSRGLRVQPYQQQRPLVRFIVRNGPGHLRRGGNRPPIPRQLRGQSPRRRVPSPSLEPNDVFGNYDYDSGTDDILNNNFRQVDHQLKKLQHNDDVDFRNNHFHRDHVPNPSPDFSNPRFPNTEEIYYDDVYVDDVDSNVDKGLKQSFADLDGLPLGKRDQGLNIPPKKYQVVPRPRPNQFVLPRGVIPLRQIGLIKNARPQPITPGFHDSLEDIGNIQYDDFSNHNSYNHNSYDNSHKQNSFENNFGPFKEDPYERSGGSSGFYKKPENFPTLQELSGGFSTKVEKKVQPNNLAHSLN